MARRQHQDVDADASHGPRLGPGPPSTDATNEHAYTFARRTQTRNCAAHVVADMRSLLLSSDFSAHRWTTRGRV
ncbi:hypothetical protein DICSQDRAFT_132927 [Dichomitus squalens LYAD-421 SS1]|uniref:uncharacterized protein n=1 Tax=Dichomitus squalens (strain LYAD-421) TaxID=732165 RepID=UPI0004412AEF|nr:uncharacterized protein DICSQDRAFT_132927 [Dichomitus squalens LYAD-421 SS1]EJF65339.1 hypothetical protein DICSQDRAFT_132927 [Dichomitus squalens LYAD-421 SS1]